MRRHNLNTGVFTYDGNSRSRMLPNPMRGCAVNRVISGENDETRQQWRVLGM